MSWPAGAVEPLGLAGALRVPLPRHDDARGSLVKTYVDEVAGRCGLPRADAEHFCTTTVAGAWRGLAFQRPPHETVKVVTCLAGEVWDVVTDLRDGSPTRGCTVTSRLTAERPEALVLPPGLAHGYLAVRGPAVVLYRTSAPHVPEAQGGVDLMSLGLHVPWPGEPVRSDRDAALPGLDAVLAQAPFGPGAGGPGAGGPA